MKGCLLFYQAFFGAGFLGLSGFVELGEAVLAALDFCGDGEAVLELGVGGEQAHGHVFLRVRISMRRLENVPVG